MSQDTTREALAEKTLDELARPCWSFDHHSFDHVSFARSVLRAALADAPAVPVQPAAWEPQFDAISHEQEQLVLKFCAEIAGPRGQKGSPPDPVRLLEMAEALYQAERKDAMLAATPAAVQPAPAILYEHEDGRHAVAVSAGHATFAAGDPKWHRVGPVDVSWLASAAVQQGREALKDLADAVFMVGLTADTTGPWMAAQRALAALAPTPQPTDAQLAAGALFPQVSGFAATPQAPQPTELCNKGCEGVLLPHTHTERGQIMIAKVPLASSPKDREDALRKALSAMLTHMGMDEEWNKPTFDQARAALAFTAHPAASLLPAQAPAVPPFKCGLDGATSLCQSCRPQGRCRFGSASTSEKEKDNG